MGWIITLGILILLALLPLGVHLRYNEDGILLKAVLGPLRITLLPRPGKTKKEKPAKKTKDKTASKNTAKAASKPADTSQQKKKGGPITDFLPLVQVALGLLNGFRRKLRVDHLEVKLILAGDDPCDLAVNYGRAWAALGNLLPRLERFLTIGKRDLQIECDFTADVTSVIARVDVTITLGRLLALVAVYGFRAAKEFLTIMKKRKGGAAL